MIKTLTLAQLIILWMQYQLASISIAQPEPEPEPETCLDADETLASKLTNGNVVEEGPSSSKIVWRDSLGIEEMEEPSSPSSSGYAGGRGSSNGSSSSGGGGFGNEEVDEIVNDNSVDGVLDSHTQWHPGKRHGNEDDASISWRKRKKHFFILSHLGKPMRPSYHLWRMGIFPVNAKYGVPPFLSTKSVGFCSLPD